MVGKTKKNVKGKRRWEQVENILLKTKSLMLIAILHLTSKCDKFHEHIISRLTIEIRDTDDARTNSL
jgi:hypothetical protein